jgi:hypothetical protein
MRTRGSKKAGILLGAIVLVLIIIALAAPLILDLNRTNPTNRQTSVPGVSAVYTNGAGSRALVFPSIRKALQPPQDLARTN